MKRSLEVKMNCHSEGSARRICFSTVKKQILRFAQDDSRPIFRRVLTILIALLTGLSITCANAADKLVFGLMGDTPYSENEAYALDNMIDAINHEPLAFVIHMGDIASGIGPCSDAWFEERKRQFQKLAHPFVIVPGDNDWVDCHRSGTDPMERLGKFRELFEAGDESLGERTMKLERQSGEFAEFREHMRWTAGNVLFVGLNVQGSNNNLGRTPAMDAEYRHRMAAVNAWIAESARIAQERHLSGLVIFCQADPDFEGNIRRKPGAQNGFAGFIDTLRILALDYPRPILFVHGDTHHYRVDHPLKDPESGKPLEHFTRVIVHGSPQTRWVRATIDPEHPALFVIQPDDPLK